MILRGPIAADQLRGAIHTQRIYLKDAGYLKHQEKAMAKRINQYEDWAFTYLDGKWIVWKHHFDKLWCENDYRISGWGRHNMRTYNTASRFIEAALREFGVANGWLPTEEESYQKYMTPRSLADAPSRSYRLRGKWWR